MLPWCSYFLKHDRWFVVVQSLSSIRLFATPCTRACQASLSFPISQNSNSCPLSQWCHPTISSFVVPLSSCLHSFPASQSFPMSHFFASSGQRIGVSASASVLPMNIQDLFPLGWTGCISLQSKGLLSVFSNTMVQKHQFFDAQLSLQSSSQIHTWLLEKSRGKTFQCLQSALVFLPSECPLHSHPQANINMLLLP